MDTPHHQLLTAVTRPGRRERSCPVTTQAPVPGSEAPGGRQHRAWTHHRVGRLLGGEEMQTASGRRSGLSPTSGRTGVRLPVSCSRVWRVMGRRSGPSLAQRSQVTAVGSTPAAPGSVPPGPEPGRRRPVITRHCWVSGLPACPGRFAGVVVEWAEGPPGWSVPRWRGRVVYIVDDGGQARCWSRRGSTPRTCRRPAAETGRAVAAEPGSAAQLHVALNPLRQSPAR